MKRLCVGRQKEKHEYERLFCVHDFGTLYRCIVGGRREEKSRDILCGTPSRKRAHRNTSRLQSTLFYLLHINTEFLVTISTEQHSIKCMVILRQLSLCTIFRREGITTHDKHSKLKKDNRLREAEQPYAYETN